MSVLPDGTAVLVLREDRIAALEKRVEELEKDVRRQGERLDTDRELICTLLQGGARGIAEPALSPGSLGGPLRPLDKTQREGFVELTTATSDFCGCARCRAGRTTS